MQPRELVESAYRAHEQGDIPTLISILDSEIELRQTELLPWGGHYRGLAGLKAFFDKLQAHVDSKVTREEFIEAGDTIVVIGWTRGTARNTGNEFDVRISHIWRIRDGKLASFEALIDTPAMLRALSVEQAA